jgi:hypothetical protein
MGCEKMRSLENIAAAKFAGGGEGKTGPKPAALFFGDAEGPWETCGPYL